jgi:hypothetical protein
MGQILCGNLCVQWLPFYNNLYIIGEATNLQDLGRHSNLKGWLKFETNKNKKKLDEKCN